MTSKDTNNGKAKGKGVKVKVVTPKDLEEEAAKAAEASEDKPSEDAASQKADAVCDEPISVEAEIMDAAEPAGDEPAAEPAEEQADEAAAIPSAEDVLEAASKIMADAELQQQIDEAQARIEELEEEVAAKRKEALEALDRYTRLQAEWDNYRKRTATERESERQRATERLVKELLPVIDDMERALAYSSADAASLSAGVSAIMNKLLDVLAKEKVTQIDPAGQPFDALIHQAVGRVEDASVPEETVMQVYQKGYEMAGRSIRSAMVTVSCGGPVRGSEEAAAMEATAPDETVEEK